MIEGLMHLADVEPEEPREVNIVKITSWEEMIKIEPGLQRLLQKAEGYKKEAMKDEDFCANRKWYGRGGLKAQMSELVGFYAKDRRLASCEAYEEAYRTIYDNLPDCRHGEGIC